MLMEYGSTLRSAVDIAIEYSGAHCPLHVTGVPRDRQSTRYAIEQPLDTLDCEELDAVVGGAVGIGLDDETILDLMVRPKALGTTIPTCTRSPGRRTIHNISDPVSGSLTAYTARQYRIALLRQIDDGQSSLASIWGYAAIAPVEPADYRIEPVCGSRIDSIPHYPTRVSARITEQCLNAGMDPEEATRYAIDASARSDNRPRGQARTFPVCRVRGADTLLHARLIQDLHTSHNELDASIIALSAMWARSRGRKAKAIRQQARAFCAEKGIKWSEVSYRFQRSYREVVPTE